MRKILVSAALAAASLTAVPAAAQYQDGGRYYDGGRHDRGYNMHRGAEQRLLAQLDNIQQRIDNNARRGRISPREAMQLQREAHQIRQRIYRAGRNGLSPREFQNISQRVDRLRYELREERRESRYERRY